MSDNDVYTPFNPFNWKETRERLRHPKYFEHHDKFKNYFGMPPQYIVDEMQRLHGLSLKQDQVRQIFKDIVLRNNEVEVVLPDAFDCPRCDLFSFPATRSGQKALNSHFKGHLSKNNQIIDNKLECHACHIAKDLVCFKKDFWVREGEKKHLRAFRQGYNYNCFNCVQIKAIKDDKKIKIILNKKRICKTPICNEFVPHNILIDFDGRCVGCYYDFNSRKRERRCYYQIHTGNKIDSNYGIGYFEHEYVVVIDEDHDIYWKRYRWLDSFVRLDWADNIGLVLPFYDPFNKDHKGDKNIIKDRERMQLVKYKEGLDYLIVIEVYISDFKRLSLDVQTKYWEMLGLNRDNFVFKSAVTEKCTFMDNFRESINETNQDRILNEVYFPLIDAFVNPSAIGSTEDETLSMIEEESVNGIIRIDPFNALNFKESIVGYELVNERFDNIRILREEGDGDTEMKSDE